MPWVNPSTVIAGAVLNATKWNQDVVSNTEFLARPPSVSVTRTTTQPLALGVWRSVAWNTEQWDTDSMWSSTAATRIDINTAGKYRIAASIPWAGGIASTAMVTVGIYAGAVGSSTSRPTLVGSRNIIPPGGLRWAQTVSAVLSFTSTQVVRIQARRDTSTGSIDHAASSGYVPTCSVMWVSS